MQLTSPKYLQPYRETVQAGATVVLPEYDLCPQVGIRDIVQQMRNALVWIYRRIKRYNGDRRRIVVCGHSAGGHLTGMMAATDWRAHAGLPNTLISATAPLSGLFDIRAHRHTDLQEDIRSVSRTAALSPMRIRRLRVHLHWLLSVAMNQTCFTGSRSNTRPTYELRVSRRNISRHPTTTTLRLLTDLGSPVIRWFTVA